MAADQPAFLDHAGVESLLVGGRADDAEGLDAELRDHEEEGHEALLRAVGEAGDDRATRPLLRGSR